MCDMWGFSLNYNHLFSLIGSPFSSYLARPYVYVPYRSVCGRKVRGEPPKYVLNSIDCIYLLGLGFEPTLSAVLVSNFAALTTKLKIFTFDEQ